MDCTRLQADLQRLQDGELEPAHASEAARHLESCAACRDLLERGRDFDHLLRQRLVAEPGAPAALREAIRRRIADPQRPAWVRALASPWTPRLAMAAVLALLVAVPFLWLPRHSAGVAIAAAEQHACHAGAPGDPLPPCCTDVPVGPGGQLGEPSPGGVVPDLSHAGLAWRQTTRCTFAPVPVHMLVYSDAAGGRFSLYMTAAGGRQFGSPAGRRSVPLAADAHHGAVRLEVTTWESQRIRYTWVGAAGPVYDAALAPLQAP